MQEKHSVTVKKLISEKGDVLKLLDETNSQKLKLEQDLKKTKDRLKKGTAITISQSLLHVYLLYIMYLLLNI